MHKVISFKEVNLLIRLKEIVIFFRYGLFMLPYVARIRFMLFIILFNALVTLLLLFLDVSLLHHAFPIHYHKWVSTLLVPLRIFAHQVNSSAETESTCARKVLISGDKAETDHGRGDNIKVPGSLH